MTVDQIAVNQRWQLGNMTYRIRSIRDDVLLVELFPARAIYPIALCDFLESGAILISDHEKETR